MMKKILTLLSVIGLALQVHAAHVAPFYFVDSNGDKITAEIEGVDKTDSVQQAYWDYLMKYKMFGALGISFGNKDINIPDKSGWFGTSQGSFDLPQNGLATIGGPIIIGGNMTFRQGPISFITGPVRVDGDVSVKEDGFKTAANEFAGTYCVEGSVSDGFSAFFSDRTESLFYGENYVNCPSTVPPVKKDLRIPLVDYNELKYDEKTVYLNNTTEYIDIPPREANGDSLYDLYIKKIDMNNLSRLVVRMPAGGRLTRIFLKEGINFGPHPKIQVMYMDSNAVYADGKWNGSGTGITNDKYLGNLLFYTEENITFPSMEIGKDSLQGSFITTGEISIADHIILAGQLLANNISINNDFDGASYIFVPFDPPEIDIKGVLNKVKFPENDTYVKIPVVLTKVPETDVYIEYCFYPGSYGGSKKGADMEDIGPVDEADVLYSMPDCRNTTDGEITDFRTIVIPAGSDTALTDETSAWIYVRIDNDSEGEEELVFYVKKISGAVVQGNATNGGVYLTLVDLDKKPPVLKDNSSLAVNENDMGASVGKIEVSDPHNESFALEITGGSGKELFDIDNEGNISLKSDVSLNYEDVQSYTVEVTATTTTDKRSSKKTYTIKVGDVNENPIARVSKEYFEAKENLKDGDAVDRITPFDTDSLNYVDNAEHSDYVIHNVVEAVGGDTTVFGVRAVEGKSYYEVYVISGDSLDFEKCTDYELLVRVRDTSAVDLWDTARIYIKVTDVDDPPVIVTKDTTVIIPNDPVNPDPDKADTLKNVGSNKALVYENNEAGVKVGVVLATCTDTTKTLYYDIAKDTSGLFEIDHSTGIISVKDAMVLDYETIKSYGISVVVYDGVVAKTVDGVDYDADGVKVQSASKDMTINVGDVNELPIMEEQKFEITEHNGEGAGVDQYGQAGKDEGNNYWIVVGDNDKSKEFTQHTLTVVGGDTALFYLGGSQGDEILAKPELDFEKYAATGDTVFTLIVKATDKEPGPNGEELSVTKTMTIVLKNKNETPEIVTDTLYVTEHSKDGTSVGTLDATDPDGDSDKLTFGVSGTSSWLDVAEDGSVTVKKDSGIDYEKTSEGTITVTVTDADGATSTKTLTVIVIDVNEAPDVRDTTITVPEDAPVGKEIGHVAASDPDTKNPEYGTLTYKQLTDSDKFQVATDGTIKLIDELDYETDSVYTLKVYVTDGTLGDTATVTVKVGNVIEASKVEIITAINTDSTWHKPDTIYVNQYDLDLIWTGDGKEFKGDTTLTEGKNIIIKEFKDPSKDLPGYDTLVVYVSTATPIVTVSKAADEIEAANIYTIVENPDDTSSTTFYVNDPKSDIKVTVKDPVDSTKSTSFTLSLNLAQESLPKVSSSTVKTVSEIADATPALNEDAPNAIRTPVNGEKIEVSYTDKIAGKDVVVSYYTDNKGNILKGESGKEEMTISYTVTVDGKDVVVSFKADPLTGSLISGENGADFAVNFDYVDKSGNSVAVSYGIDEKGNIAKSASGDVGYNVSYTYVNKYGNSATQSVFIVLDQKAPLVWIKTPTKDQVIHANMVEVEWYVSVTGDSADFVLQDTLKVQGLEKGANAIVRFFIDKAGNMASDTVYVIMKNAKDVDIAVEKPLTVVNADSVAKYYADNPPKKGQTFAVSLSNPTTGEEQETLIGGSFKTKSGSGETPYKGNEGAHLGPTMSVDLKLPVYNSVGGLATLDDLVGKDGLVSLDGVDAKNSKKVTVEEYAKEYCSTDFNVNLGSDISKANLYKTSIKVKIWVYTTLGNFVDYFSFTQDLNDPELVDEAGLIKMYFEQKPDVDGFVRTADGKLYATGAYLYKTEVEMRSTAQCTLPPVDERTGIKKGSRRKTTDDLLKPFGYKRPTVK